LKSISKSPFEGFPESYPGRSPFETGRFFEITFCFFLEK
jgi:hypothetical protein